MWTRLFVVSLALGLTGSIAGPAAAQAKQRIEKAADLPRFTYKIDGKVEDLLRDDAKFGAFATDVRRDAESTLAKYDIADKSSERQLRGTLLQLDMLDGRYDDALAEASRIQALQEKPADKLLSGMATRAVVAGQRKAGNRDSDAYRNEVSSAISSALQPMPFEVIANDIRENKARAETLGEGPLIGAVRESLQPVVDKSGSLSSDLAPNVVAIKYALVFALPLKQTFVSTYTTYLDAHHVDKPDIWAAREVTLPASGNYTPVIIGIWDSGTDTPLYPGRVVMNGGKPAVIAFDRFSNPATGELMPIPADLKTRLPEMKARLKGFSDLRSNIDSPEASRSSNSCPV